MIYLYYSDKFQSYNFGPEHPFNPARLMLTCRLMEELGLIDGQTCLVEPSLASEADLQRVHTTEYLAAVRMEEPDFAFGLGSDDTPVFPGIYDASRLLAGASITAARSIIDEAAAPSISEAACITPCPPGHQDFASSTILLLLLPS